MVEIEGTEKTEETETEAERRTAQEIKIGPDLPHQKRKVCYFLFVIYSFILFIFCKTKNKKFFSLQPHFKSSHSPEEKEEVDDFGRIVRRRSPTPERDDRKRKRSPGRRHRSRSGSRGNFVKPFPSNSIEQIRKEGEVNLPVAEDTDLALDHDLDHVPHPTRGLTNQKQRKIRKERKKRNPTLSPDRWRP